MRGVLLGSCAGVLAGVIASGCGAGSAAPPSASPVVAPGEPPLWVLATHPDDEALLAANVIARAVRERAPLFVHLMTNGDLGCERDGFARERETVAAMRVLGLSEDRIRFLGYPDGHLELLGAVPLAPLERRLADGSCGAGATTYGAHGERGVDVHNALHGAPGAYTAQSAVADLAALLLRDRPRDVYVVHPIDAHPDHAMTYVLLRRALEQAALVPPPRLHRGIVHAGGCWPNGSDPAEPCDDAGESFGTPYPPLPEPLSRYLPSEHLAVPDGGAIARRAIAEYRSQLHADVENDWLGDFARAEAIYWPETLVPDPAHPGRLVRAPAAGVDSGRASAASETGADGDLTWHSIDQRAPLRVAFDATVPSEGAASVRFLARSDVPEASGYELEIAGDHAVELRRAGGRVMRRLRIADDGARHALHHWELRIDVRPDDAPAEGGPIAEFELRRDGALVGVMIDALPILEGKLVVTRAQGGARIDALALEGERRSGS